jgi:hypothetical protein
MTNELFALKGQLDQRDLFFCFKGPISQGLVAEMGGLLQQKMGLENVKKMAIMRVFGVVVENAQNILRYSAERIMNNLFSGQEQELSVGIIAVGQENGHFFVLSGNTVANHQVEPLRQRLDRLQTMTQEELKELYLNQRRQEQPPGSKGAGLGLIDMARKSSRPLAYEFETIDADHAFFSLKIVI